MVVHSHTFFYEECFFWVARRMRVSPDLVGS